MTSTDFRSWESRLQAARHSRMYLKAGRHNDRDEAFPVAGFAKKSALPVAPFIVLLVLLANACVAQADDRPNILFLLADDLGYGDIGCYGREDIRTPRLDRLANEGVRLTAHYANGPECTPTRVALLTGRYPQRVGGLECAIGIGNVGRYDDAIRLAQQHELGLPTSEPSIVRILKDVGYATAITGKWHLGYDPQFQPHRHGFDKTFYCVGGGMDYFYYLDTLAGYNLFVDGNPIHREGYFTDLLTDEAIGFLEQPRDKPFLLYVPFTCPHSPFQGPDDHKENPLPLDSPLWKQGSAPPDVYIAMIERMDACIGRLLDTLDELNMTENTLVIFAGDNGGTRSARNAPYSGYKGSTYEGGIRVPGIVRWPGHLAAGSESTQPCMTFDFTKSIARVAGASEPVDQPFDGIDIVKHLAAGSADQKRSLYWRKPRGDSLWKGFRDGDLKWISQRKGERVEESLFDLSSDPAEQHNLREEQPEEFARLKGLYDEWEREVRAGRRGQAER